VLINISISNYKSFRQDQSINLNATSSIIYGQNASGKSNLISCLPFIINFIDQSTYLSEDEFKNFAKVTFCNDLFYEPTLLNLKIAIDGVSYEVFFKFSNDKVIQEYIHSEIPCYPQLLFNREYIEANDSYELFFNPCLKMNNNLNEINLKNTELFLSAARSTNGNHLKPIYDFFYEQLVIVNNIDDLDRKVSLDMLKNEKEKKIIIDFFNELEIKINDISYIDYRLQFHYSTYIYNLLIDFEKESSSIKRLFFLLGIIINVIKNGKTLFIDDFDDCFHPLIIKKLIDLFNSKTYNQKNAQIIFTSTNPLLLDSKFITINKIITLTRENDLSTNVYSDNEIRHNKSKNIKRRY
jgi:uncharacterized protein